MKYTYTKELYKMAREATAIGGSCAMSTSTLSALLDELDRLQQASRWIPVSDPPKHPNWVIAQDEQNNIFPVTFRDLRWLDDEGDELPPYYPQIIKWREMPPPEGE